MTKNKTRHIISAKVLWHETVWYDFLTSQPYDRPNGLFFPPFSICIHTRGLINLNSKPLKRDLALENRPRFLKKKKKTSGIDTSGQLMTSALTLGTTCVLTFWPLTPNENFTPIQQSVRTEKPTLRNELAAGLQTFCTVFFWGFNNCDRRDVACVFVCIEGGLHSALNAQGGILFPQARGGVWAIACLNLPRPDLRGLPNVLSKIKNMSVRRAELFKAFRFFFFAG